MESPENHPKGSLVASFFSSRCDTVLFFLRKEKEKNGGAKTRAGNARPYGIYFGAVENRAPTIPPSRLRRATSLYTREAIRCGGMRADRGVRPYKNVVIEKWKGER